MFTQNSHRQILLSPLFLCGLLLLLLNDFYLKAQFGNFLTGKLSDFAGLFVFPLFWSAVFPRRKTFILVSTAAFFVFWKSPLSQAFIDFWNGLEIFRVGRTIDYSDLTALLLLPLAGLYAEKFEPIRLFVFSQKFAVTAVALISVFAFTATSQAGKMNQMEEFEQTYKLQSSPLETSKKLQEFNTGEFRQTKSGNNGLAYFNIELHEKVCDGFPTAHFSVAGGEQAQIKLNMILYPCDNKLPDQNEKLRKMFESEIIDFLNKR